MIVITGGAGFIGSNLVAELNDRGYTDLAVCDRLGSDGRWRNLHRRMFRDFVFPEELHASLNRLRPDAILHMGANSSTTATDADEIMRNNILFTLRLVDWCAEAKVPLIYASSAATYGNGSAGFVDIFSYEALRRLAPLNLYGWSKHHIDLIIAERAEKSMPLPPKCIGLKYFNVYGPNEYHKGSMISVVGKSYETVSRGGSVDLFQSHREDYGHGEQRRDFIYIDDVVAVTLWFLENGPAHGIFNVGTGQATTFASFIGALFKACGRRPEINYIPMPDHLRDRYQYFTEASTQNLRAAGYITPFLSAEEGVARYAAVLGSEDPYR